MRFVADEGVDSQIVDRLRAEEHDLIYIAEISIGLGDDLILRFANEKNFLKRS